MAIRLRDLLTFFRDDPLGEGWGECAKRVLEEIEIIDVLPEEELIRTWDLFIHSHHYGTMNDLRYSLLWRYPRRSCESFWNMTMQLAPDKERHPPEDVDLSTLRDWYCKAIEQEIQYEEPVA